MAAGAFQYSGQRRKNRDEPVYRPCYPAPHGPTPKIGRAIYTPLLDQQRLRSGLGPGGNPPPFASYQCTIGIGHRQGSLCYNEYSFSVQGQKNSWIALGSFSPKDGMIWRHRGGYRTGVLIGAAHAVTVAQIAAAMDARISMSYRYHVMPFRAMDFRWFIFFSVKFSGRSRRSMGSQKFRGHRRPRSVF